MDLRTYEQHKFALAEILRGASRLVPEAQRETRSRLRELITRLAEDRFNLVLVGRFSRGKTSLMNAILGTDRLPTGLAPLTSVITTVTYGSNEQVALKFRNSIMDQEVPISALPEYITQAGNPGNVRGIRVAEVQLAAEILRRGFYFVDTPGLGSVIRENTLTTEAFLPEADAFILVTSYDSPLSEEELRFFRAGSLSGRRIFVVLNKQDLASTGQREGVRTFVEQQLRGIFGAASPKIFSVSSTEAQKAKRQGNTAALKVTGIPELEKELVQFLLTEKQAHFLLRMCERVQQSLQDLPVSAEAIKLKSHFAVLNANFRAEANASPGQPSEDLVDFSSTEHCAQPCEICGDVGKAIWDFICKYQYRIASVRDEQERFATRGGFCPFHTWEYQSVASAYGSCNAYPALLDRLSGELRVAAAGANATQAMLAGAPAELAADAA